MTAPLRRRVLDTALVLIAEAGVASLSLREVARRAGVSHQAPYRHFPDREAILAALQEEGFAGLADALEAAEAAPRDQGTMIVAVAEAYVTYAMAHPEHYALLFRTDLVDASRFPELRAQGERAFAVLRRIAASLVGPGEPEEVVVARLWAVVHGLAELLRVGALPVRGATVATADLVRAVVGPLASGARLPDSG